MTAIPVLSGDGTTILEVVATIAKAAIAAHPRKSGVIDGQDVRRFGQAVGRKYARWAIPEEVRPWLAPLERILASKAGKDTSALGRVLEDVLEIRVRAEPSWMDDPPLELTVQLVVKAGVLPTFANDDLPDLPPSLMAGSSKPPRPRGARLVKWRTGSTEAVIRLSGTGYGSARAGVRC